MHTQGSEGSRAPLPTKHDISTLVPNWGLQIRTQVPGAQGSHGCQGPGRPQRHVEAILGVCCSRQRWEMVSSLRILHVFIADLVKAEFPEGSSSCSTKGWDTGTEIGKYSERQRDTCLFVLLETTGENALFICKNNLNLYSPPHI